MKQTNKSIFFLIILAFAAWGRLFYLQGLLWDDWYFIWKYFSSESYSQFIFPYQSLGHSFDGIIFYQFCNLFKYFKGDTTSILNIIRFFLFTLNGILIFFIFKKLMRNKTMLPEIIGAIYMVSPLVNKIEIDMIYRTIYLSAFLLSVLLTIIILNKRRINWLYYIVSIILSAFAITAFESFIFVEIFRPVVIYYIISKDTKISLKPVILHWLPYIFIGACILLYTMFIPRFGAFADTYHPSGIFSIPGLLQIIKGYTVSLYYLFIDVYKHNVSLAALNGDIWTFLMSFLAVWITVKIFFNIHEKEKAQDVILWETKGMMIFGLLWILASIFPYAATRGYIQNSTLSGYALQANVGIAVFIPASIFYLYYKNIITKRLGQVIISIIVLLGVGICNTVVKINDNDWQQQRSFWWQFMWRVPDMKEGTYLIIDLDREEKFICDEWAPCELMGPLRVLYATSKGENGFAGTSYAFGDIADTDRIQTFIKNRYSNTVTVPNNYVASFNYHPKNYVVASYIDEVLSLNGDIKFPDIERQENIHPFSSKGDSFGEAVRRPNIGPFIANANADGILMDTKKSFPFRWVMGDEPKNLQINIISLKMNKLLDRHIFIRDWRYYYQNAEVLLMKKDYSSIVKLYDDACVNGLDSWLPHLPEMLVPFIESLYITQDYSRGSALLWKWALYSNGSLSEAIEMKNKILTLGEYRDSANRLNNDIKEVFHN